SVPNTPTARRNRATVTTYSEAIAMTSARSTRSRVQAIDEFKGPIRDALSSSWHLWDAARHGQVGSVLQGAVRVQRGDARDLRRVGAEVHDEGGLEGSRSTGRRQIPTAHGAPTPRRWAWDRLLHREGGPAPRHGDHAPGPQSDRASIRGEATRGTASDHC